MPIGSTNVYNVGDLILSTVSGSGTSFIETKIAAATSSLILFNSSATLTSQSLNSTTVGTSSYVSGSTSIITNLTASNISASSKIQTNQITASSILANNGPLMVTGSNAYIQMFPVGGFPLPTNLTASYIYTSGSTNDLYFTQYSGPYTNTTRLRWLESNLYTGILHGGVLTSTPGSTTFTVTEGEGLIVSLNAFTASAPYPTVKLIQWPTSTQPIIYSGSANITYVGIDNVGAIVQQTNAWGSSDINQWDNQIELGVVLHLSGSVSNGVFNSPQISYGIPQQTDDFFRAFGPLKISGHTLQASGSTPTLSIKKSGGIAYREGANYVNNPNHPSTVTEGDANISKIYRYYISGSTPIIDTGIANAGYTTIDNDNYVNTATGQLDTVGNSNWTIQRVFWIPNSPTNAFIVYYGNATYSTLLNAVNAKDSEPFTESPNTSLNAIFIGYIIIEGGAGRDLLNAAECTIIQGGLFRNVGGIGSSGTSPVSTTLAGLSDVALAGLAEGDLLVYGGGQWNNKKTLIGSYIVSGSLSVQSGITGNLTGTSSWATNAVTSSFALTASYVSGSTSIITNLTASNISASGVIIANSFTGSFSGSITNAVTAISASFSTNSLTASYLTPTNSYTITNLTASNISASATGSFGIVGIGTSSPTGSLHVNNSVANIPILNLGGGVSVNNVSDLYVLNSYNTASGVGFAAKVIGVNISGSLTSGNIPVQRTVWSGVNSATAIVLSADDPGGGTDDNAFQIWTSNQGTSGSALTQKFTLTTDGNVGIGTTNPAHKLQLGTLTSTSTATPEILSLGGTFSNTDGSNPKLRIWTDGTYSIGLGVSSNQLDYILGRNFHDHVFYAEGSRLMTIKGGGNVGIGTSSPNAKLQVAGNVSGSSFTSSISNAVGFLGTASWAQNVVSASFATTAQTANALNTGNSYTIAGLTNNGTLSQQGTLSMGSGYQILATTGTSPIPGIAFVGDTNTGIYSPGADTIGFSISGSEKVRINNSGSVGVGTNNPLYKLHIVGNVYGTTTGQFGNAVITGTGTGFAVYGSNAGATGVKINLDSDISRNDLVISASSGYVGIGTSSPSAKLTIVDNTNGGTIHLVGRTSDDTAAINFRATGDGSTYAYISPDTNEFRMYHNDGFMSFYPGGTEKVRITSGGLVGIGTTSVNNKLDIWGSTGTTFNMANTDDSGRGGKLTFISSSAAGRQFYVGTNSAIYNLTFGIDSIEKMRLDTNGNVGIGVTSPSGRLHITGSATSNETLLCLSKGSASISQTFINAFDQSGASNYRVTTDINGYAQQTLFRSGTSYVYHDAYWSSWINNANYAQGGLALGTGSLTHGYGLTIAKPSTSGSLYVSGSTIITGTLNVSTNITCLSLTETSTEAVKYNILPLSSQLDNVLKLKPVSFNYKTNDKHSIGLIAEEVAKIYPEFTSDNNDSISYGKITSVLIQSIKELKNIIDNQQNQIEDLSNKLKQF
jgi:hypothetical protein